MEMFRIAFEFLYRVDKIDALIAEAIEDEYIRRMRRKPYTFARRGSLLFFSSMLPSVSRSVLLSSLKRPIRNVYHIKASCSGKLSTLSPIYSVGSPEEEEFREKIIEELEARIVAFRGIEPRGRPRVKVYSYERSGEARHISFELDSKIHACAGILGGFGLNTHLGLGYVLNEERLPRSRYHGD